MQAYTRRERPNERALLELERRGAMRRCRRCRAMVERSSGCNHMTCRCGYQFCYLCGGEYTPDHFGEDNIFGCAGMQFAEGEAARQLRREVRRGRVRVGVALAVAAPLAAALAVPGALVGGPLYGIVIEGGQGRPRRPPRALTAPRGPRHPRACAPAPRPRRPAPGARRDREAPRLAGMPGARPRGTMRRHWGPDGPAARAGARDSWSP
eukprot:tig00020960_g16566.t1